MMSLSEGLFLLTLRVFNHITILIGICRLRIIIPSGKIIDRSFAHFIACFKYLTH